MKTSGKDLSNPQLNTISLGMALLWSTVILVLGVWNYWQTHTAALEMARSSAYQSYSKDLVYRRWKWPTCQE